ncbi:MAG: Ldh family oxidoreductase [Treponemataceae bacterium]
MSETTIERKRLSDFVAAVFAKSGVPSDEAEIIADSLTEADLTGVESHGVSRVPIYLKRIETGVVNAAAKLEVVADLPGALVLDGCNSMGIVTGVRAMDMAIKKVQTSGAVFVTIRNSNHFGIAAYFTRMALLKDMIGYTASNAPSTMAPWGGIKPYMGTNPFSVALPAGTELPIVMDMATSVVAQGKIILAAKEGKPIPFGWALTKDGEPTNDPKAALEGTVLPFGGPKGYSISLLLDVLSGVLSGAAFGPYLSNMWNDFEHPQNVGHCMGVMDVKMFLPIDEFKRKMDTMIRDIKSNPRAKGVDEIFLPGEIEHRKREKRIAEGIPLGLKTYADLEAIGARMNLTI